MEGSKILIVDDTAESLRLVARLLAEEGHSLRLAMSAEEALEVLGTGYRPDLVLLDMLLPGMSGTDLCCRLKGDPVLRSLPVLFLSAWDDPGHRIQAFECGGADYIAKPFHAEELKARVRTHLRLVGVDRLEEALSEQKRLLRQIRQSQRLAHVGTWTLSGEHGLEWSDEMYEIFDVPKETPATELVAVSRSRVHPEDASLVDEVKRTTAEGRNFRPLEHRLVHRDGSVRHIWVEAYREEGDETRLWGIVLDTTEHHRNRNLQEDLARQLEAAHRFDALGRLAAGISHTFNNLMGIIQGQAVLGLALADGRKLVEGMPGELGIGVHSVRERLERILVTIERARRLTGQLMSFARMQGTDLRRVDVGQLITEQQEFFRETLGEGIVLTWERPEEAFPVRIDPMQLGQVLEHLCSNAKDAMEGRGCVRVELRRETLKEGTRILDTVAPAGDYVVISVKDTGPGLCQEAKEHLFEPFFSTKGACKGNGLGLATSWGMVRNHGGVMRLAESETGACFEVLLPWVAEPVQGGDASPRNWPGTALVVDDEDMLVEYIAEVLRQSGWKVLSTTDARHALLLAQSHTRGIDLVVTDVMMPFLNGFELVERIHEFRPQVRHLLVSGYARETLEEKGGKGKWNILSKPFGIRELKDRIDALRERESIG